MPQKAPVGHLPDPPLGSPASGRDSGRARGDSRGSFWMEWLRIGFWTRLRKLFSILTLEVRRLASARDGGIWWISEVAERQLARWGIAAEDFRGEDEFESDFFRRRLRRRLRRTTYPHYSPTQSGAKLSATQRSGRGPKSEDFGTRFGPARGDSRGSFWMEWLRNQFWTRLRKLFSIPT